MTWGLQFLGALLWLMPGLVGYIGFQGGSRQSHLGVRDHPNSMATLMVVLICAVAGHFALAGLLWGQQLYCAGHACFDPGFDPNLYRSLLDEHHHADLGEPGAVALMLGSDLALSAAVGSIAYQAGRMRALRIAVRPDTPGWARNLADHAADTDKLVIAYALTRLGEEGRFAGYEGIVEHIGLEDGSDIRSLILSSVDKFVVKVTDEGLRRYNGPDETPMELMALSGQEIANLSFTIVDLSIISSDLPEG